MAREWFGLVFVTVLCLTGCSSPASTDPDDYVGEYVFHPSNTDAGEFADFLILKADHIAVEIRFSRSTGQISTTEERWHLDHTTEENVVIGNFSHPVEGSRSSVRLGINGDLDLYYQKVR